MAATLCPANGRTHDDDNHVMNNNNDQQGNFDISCTRSKQALFWGGGEYL